MYQVCWAYNRFLLGA